MLQSWAAGKEPLRCSVLFAALENGPIFMGRGLSEIRVAFCRCHCCYDMSSPVMKGRVTHVTVGQMDASMDSGLRELPVRQGHLSKKAGTGKRQLQTHQILPCLILKELSLEQICRSKKILILRLHEINMLKLLISLGGWITFPSIRRKK